MGEQSGLLTSLFRELVERNFQNQAIDDFEVKSYITALLTEFAEVNNLYKIRDTNSRPVDDVGHMLIDSNPLLEAASFDRERQVRKHIGDFTLFFSGMFPESIGRWRMSNMRLESFVDYMKAGKESYNIVAAFDQWEYKKVAPLFRRLSDEFEMCVFGLNMVRHELEIGQPRFTRQLHDIIM